jgi:hypothetical protein
MLKPIHAKAMKKICENPAATHEFVASMSDCTGLIPSLPTADGQIESYADIVPIPECEVKP